LGEREVRKKIAAMICLLPAVSACASKSSNIQASYVSPVQYQHYSCPQLVAEGQRVSGHAARIAGQQDENRTSDAVLTGVAVVLFWPALFALEGDGQTAAELARLKGEMDAIQQASIQKNCGIEFRQG
jgi:thiamine biosynthesis protein ThiC